MIHRIKALYDEGRGLSIRAIARELGVSRNTVRTYLRQDTQAICEQRADVSGSRRLDAHRDYIEHLLRRYPKHMLGGESYRLKHKSGG